MINEAEEETKALSQAVEAEDGGAQEAAVSQTTNKRKAKEASAAATTKESSAAATTVRSDSAQRCQLKLLQVHLSRKRDFCAKKKTSWLP